jgi:hypothetical protein
MGEFVILVKTLKEQACGFRNFPKFGVGMLNEYAYKCWIFKDNIEI